MNIRWLESTDLYFILKNLITQYEPPIKLLDCTPNFHPDELIEPMSLKVGSSCFLLKSPLRGLSVELEGLYWLLAEDGVYSIIARCYLDNSGCKLGQPCRVPREYLAICRIAPPKLRLYSSMRDWTEYIENKGKAMIIQHGIWDMDLSKRQSAWCYIPTK